VDRFELAVAIRGLVRYGSSHILQGQNADRGHWRRGTRPILSRICLLTLVQDSITGLLLAGVGHINEHQKKNFLVVDPSALASAAPPPFLPNPSLETQISTIEAAFQEFTERKDVAIILINQHVRTTTLFFASVYASCS